MDGCRLAALTSGPINGIKSRGVGMRLLRIGDGLFGEQLVDESNG